MPLQLELQVQTKVPIEVEGLTPDAIAGLSRSEIEQFPVFHGNRQMPLAELFSIAGDANDLELRLAGDLSGVHWIGAKMTAGRILVEGSAGRHVGSEMAGGEIHVTGDVGDWLGGEMQGGLIRVQGNAGHLVGAAYRGSRRGMTGGVIAVSGSAGNEIGHTMRRGLIAVGGQGGDLIGFNMLAGTVLTLGEVGIRHGAGMKRGTLALLGPERPPLLPTFRRAGEAPLLTLALLLRHLREIGFETPADLAGSPVELHHGDMIEGGRGEIWLRPAA